MKVLGVRLLALGGVACLLLTGCATRSYVRREIHAMKCTLVLESINRENRYLWAMTEELERMNKRSETAEKMSEIGRSASRKTRQEFGMEDAQ
jgi:hypothetical protein